MRKTAKSKSPKVAAKAAKTPAKKARRKTFKPQARQEILATAAKEGLTAKQVQQKFGVSMVTFYQWRKRAGLSGQRGVAGRGVAHNASSTPLPADLQKRVRTEVQSAMNRLVREEVEHYLRMTLGALTKR